MATAARRWVRMGRDTDAAPGGDAGEGDDATLVARAQSDPAAFEGIYTRYADLIYRYARRRLGDHHLAEDIAARVFLQAFAALPRYRERGSFRSWLFAIAHNLITDLERRRAHESNTTSDLDDGPEAASQEASPEQQIIAAEGRDALQRALIQLPLLGRRIVELRLAGLTGPEIAAVLGKRQGAIRIAQLRAFRQLRDLLTTNGDSQ